MDNILLLKKYAIRYLSKYSSSKGNLERVIKNKIRRLDLEKKEKFFLYNAIDKILIELESKNFINDNSYCESKIINLSNQGKSRIYIINYLIQKKIEKKIIDKVFNFFDAKNPEWEINSAKIFARKKNINTNESKNKQKDLSKMARAGFDYKIIKLTLNIN